MRAKVHRELLAEEEEETTGTRGIIYHPPVYRRNSLQMLFNLPDGKPSFLPSSTSYAFRSVDIPRLLSFCARYGSFSLSLVSIRRATPFANVPFYGSLDTAAFPLPFCSLSRHIFHFFSRVIRFRVFAFIWIPPNALLGKWLVACKTITTNAYRDYDKISFHVCSNNPYLLRRILLRNKQISAPRWLEKLENLFFISINLFLLFWELYTWLFIY